MIDPPINAMALQRIRHLNSSRWSKKGISALRLFFFAIGYAASEGRILLVIEFRPREIRFVRPRIPGDDALEEESSGRHVSTSFGVESHLVQGERSTIGTRELLDDLFERSGGGVRVIVTKAFSNPIERISCAAVLGIQLEEPAECGAGGLRSPPCEKLLPHREHLFGPRVVGGWHLLPTSLLRCPAGDRR
jgi:hypothetical protein